MHILLQVTTYLDIRQGHVWTMVPIRQETIYMIVLLTCTFAAQVSQTDQCVGSAPTESKATTDNKNILEDAKAQQTTATDPEASGSAGGASAQPPPAYVTGLQACDVRSRRLVVLRSRRQRQQRKALRDRLVEAEAHRLLQPVVNMLLLGPDADVGLRSVPNQVRLWKHFRKH